LATVAALFVTSSSYIDWFANRTAVDTPLHRLYETSVGAEAASYWRSVALPLAVVTVLGVIGLFLRSRIVFSVGWLVGAATVVLFIAMLYNDDAVDFAFADLQAGVWQAMVALGVMLIGIVLFGGQARREPVAVEARVAEEKARRADEAAGRADEAAGRAAEAAGRADAAAGRTEPGPTRTDTEHVGRAEHAERPGRGRRWWRGRRAEPAHTAETERAEAESAEEAEAEQRT
jgi:hypothetical protein